MQWSYKSKFSAAVLAIAVIGSPAVAASDQKQMTVAQRQSAFELDRADILAMAGDYKVTFDMKETTAWRDDYEPIKAKISGGHESVRVIEDTGNKIVLQHLLVVGEDDNPFIVKHWRQDWEYEPKQILVYAGRGEWALEEVPEAKRKGRWAQTVYQVDDSPRYAGWGEWKITNGVRQWSSNWTVRPLARRDATRNPVYDHYRAINRHQPMPGGWIHWQDNSKMKWVDGKALPYVQETVLNTYKKFDEYPVEAADNYWAKTKGYWKVVRAEWDAAMAKHGGITVEEEANTGTVISGKLLEMGTKISKGEMKEAAAIKEARSLIRDATGKKPLRTAAKKSFATTEY